MATYRVHTFETSGDLVINSLTGNAYYDTVDYLIVAGGGGGGGAGPAPSTWRGSGGGAGGLLIGNTSVSAQTYQVIVGSGGAGGIAVSPYVPGGPGSNSSVFGSVASGGGGGAGDWQQLNPPDYGGIDGKRGRPGGSGGGSNWNSTSTPSSPNVGWGAGTPGQGNPGGVSSSNPLGAGGGGAGGAGENAGSGGIGVQSGISGSLVWYAGGGPARGIVANPNQGNLTVGGGGLASGSATIPGFSGIDGKIIVRYPVEVIPIQSKVSRVSNVTANTSVPGFIDFGSNILFEISTTNASNGESMYYYTSGNASLFSSANTGTLVFNANSATVTLTVASTPGDFTLNVKRNEESSAVLYTSDPISIISAFYNNAIGGNVIIEGDYKLHVFLTSNTFQVLAVGAVDSNISYAVLAGGGGYNDPTETGGGGGGLIQGTISLAPYGAGNLEIIVGSGGTGSPSAASSPGGRSYIKNSSNALYLEAFGGGAVGPASPGIGGSGGGITGPAAANHPLGIGTGIPGQGFPGGAFSLTAPPAGQGKAGGGGAGGAGGDGRYVSGPLYGVGGDGANIHIAPYGYGYYGGSVSPAPQPATPSNRWFGGGGSGKPLVGAPVLNQGLVQNPAVVVYMPAPSSPSPFGFIPSQRMGTGTGGGGQGELAQSGIVFIKYKYK